MEQPQADVRPDTSDALRSAEPVHSAAGDDRQIPLSVGQEAMWIGWKLDPGQWTHIIPTPFRVSGTLDADRLRQAVTAVGDAYPLLRARVAETPQGLRLCWSDAPPVPLREHAVTGELTEEVRRTWQRPFDLRRGPLARVDVLHGPDWTVLLLAVHHLVFDGASILTLLDRLRRGYAGEPLGGTDHTDAVAAFAARSRDLADGPAGDAHRAHWRGVLGGDLPVLDLPASVDEPHYTALDTMLPGPLVARLRERARRLEVSYLTMLFSSYFVLLRRYCGQDDLLASLPFHGRTDPELRDAVGYFVNALPIRHQVRGEDTFAEVVRGVRSVLRAATAHGDLPLPAILRAVGLTGWQARDRTHRTVFQYWHAGLRAGVDVQDVRLSADGRECRLALLGMESSADYTLAVMVREDSGGTHVLWKDPTGSVGPTLLRMLSDDYTAVLAALADHPDWTVGGLTDQVLTARGLVESRRIAALVGSHPGVRRAVVTPTGGGADLHVRVTTGTPLTETDVLALVRAEFGERTPSVRVDIRQDGAAAAPRSIRREETQPAVSALVQVWEEVLGISGITSSDSFFELGGHSLLAESLVIAVGNSLGRDVPVRALFEYPRLEDFAAHLGIRDAPAPSDAAVEDGTEGTGHAESPPEQGPAGLREDVFHAAGFQQRIWLAERVDSGVGAYNVPLAWRVTKAPLRVATLGRALELLVTRHDILRTRFVERDGRLWQHVGEPWMPRPEHVDLRAHEDPGGALREWLKAAADHPFDPMRGRLLRAALLETGEDGQVLFICLHHLVWDGESAGTFLRELDTCYAEAAQRNASQLMTASGSTLQAPEGRLPAPSTVRAMADLWAGLLNVPRVGPDDSFFALGGYSMLALRMVRRVREGFGVDVPLRALFEKPRLREFADVVDSLTTTAAAPRLGTAGAHMSAASGFQERIWLAERYGADITYHVSLAWRAPLGLDHDLLQQALTLLVTRHEILRTSFAEDAGGLRQHVGPPWTPHLERVDMTHAVEPDEVIHTWLDRQVAEPFDPSSGRMLRPALAELGPHGHALLLCLHHLIVDGESIPPLLKDLQQCYLSVRDNVPLPAPPAQYRDVIAAQQTERHTPRREADLAYWERHLKDAPTYGELPLPAEPEAHGGIPLSLPTDLAARLHAVQQDHRVSWFMIAATALAAVLHQTSERRDVTFGVPASIRDRARFADVIGPCVNTVVLRSRPDPDATLLDLLRTMRTELLDAFEHRGAPFEDVIERLNPVRRPGRTPYADVSLNVTSLTGRGTRLGDTTLIPVLARSPGENETKFALTVTLIERDGDVSGILSYRGDQVTATGAGRIADRLSALLARFPSALDQAWDHRDSGEVPSTGSAQHLHARSQDLHARSQPVQYRNFVAFQEAERGSARRAAELAYWERHLTGAPQYLDFPAPSTPGASGSVPVPLPADLVTRMSRVLTEHGFTLYQLSAGALAALLHRWTGFDDVVFSTVMTYRDHPDFLDVIGPCLNTVVLRSRPRLDATLLDLLHDMRTEMLDAFEHRGAPFEDVVQRLNPVRRPGRTPYADVALSFEAGQDRSARLGDSHLVRLPSAGDGVGYLGKLGLAVVLSLHGGALSGSIAYRGDRYRRPDVEQFALLFGRLLAALPDCLGACVDALDLVGEDAERLRAWESGGEPATPTRVPALVGRWVRETPHAPAVETAHGTLTYRGLHESAAALAARIRPVLRAEDPVALVFERGAEFIVSMLATWYVGAAFCPIEPATPPARIDALLTDLNASVVLSNDPTVTERLSKAGTTVINVADDVLVTPRTPADSGATRATSPEDVPLPATDVDDPRAPAYIIYTSGTMGEPKGVVIRHQSLAQLVLWGRESFALTPEDRCGNLLGAAFDVTQWDVWSALASGACVVPHEGPLVPTMLPHWLDSRRITVAALSAPLAETLWAANPPLPHLRWMLSGGAALTRLPPPDTSYQVRNCYGPTEATVKSLTRDMDAHAEGPLNSLDRPVTGTQALVLDRYGNRCPVGVVGELCLSGMGVAAGYWRSPELTRERFRQTGPDGEPSIVYRTGDRARRLSNGMVEYLGRLDRQMKIRGYRMEPGEIEAALLRYPGITAAVVHGDPQRSPNLVAYLVSARQPRPAMAELLEALRAWLPSPMLPEAFVWLDEVPLTPNGKTDLARLPRPRRENLPVTSQHVPAASDTEKVIAEAWATVLQLPEVGIHDNFFDLGGNSLSLAALHALLTERLSADLTLVSLFAYPTVATQARSLAPAAELPKSSPNDALQERAARARQAAAMPHPRAAQQRGPGAPSAERATAPRPEPSPPAEPGA